MPIERRPMRAGAPALLLASLLLPALLLPASPAAAQKGMPATTVLIDGVALASDRDVMENLALSPEHQTFVALLRASGVADTLRQHGPFTVFAPTDAAFAALPPGTLDALLRLDDKAALVRLLQGHILPGTYSSTRLRLLMRGKGQAELEDMGEGRLTVGTNGPSNIVLRDTHSTTADIILYDIKQANGVVFVIDRVLTPG